MRAVNRQDVKIKVLAEPCDVSLESQEREFGADYVAAVRQNLRKSRKWGWCDVTVEVSLVRGPKLSGRDYLGCCSHISQKDFVENSGYYEQMVQEAIGDLQERLCEFQEKVYQNLRDLREFVNLESEEDFFDLLAMSYVEDY